MDSVSRTQVLLSIVTRFNAIPHDIDIVVTVRSGLLVPEAQSVQDLMLNGSQTVTVSANGQLLLPHMLVAYRGVASIERGSLNGL